MPEHVHHIVKRLILYICICLLAGIGISGIGVHRIAAVLPGPALWPALRVLPNLVLPERRGRAIDAAAPVAAHAAQADRPDSKSRGSQIP